MRRVYFIKPIGFDSPIKIGCTTNIQERFAGLSLQSPWPLEILATIEGGLTVERQFHTKFLSSRLRGEWFVSSPDLLDTIAAIAAGRFDVETLPAPVCLPCRKPIARSSHRERVIHDELLLSDILEFCAKNHIAESTFGRRAISDPAFVMRLRQGCGSRQITIARVRTFMTSPEQAAAA